MSTDLRRLSKEKLDALSLTKHLWPRCEPRAAPQEILTEQLDLEL
jgi:hypothetical protein